MSYVDVSGTSYASGGPGDAFYACAPRGGASLAFLMFDGVGSFWNEALGRAARDLHVRFHEVAAELAPDWGALVKALDEQLCAEDHTYCSIVVGEIDREKKELTILNAGHGGTSLRREQPRRVELLAPGGCVGVGANTFQWSVCQREIRVGDLLLLTSTGVEEVANEEGKPFGEDAIVEMLHEDAPGDGSSRAWMRQLFQRLDRHGSPHAEAPVALALSLDRWSDDA